LSVADRLTIQQAMQRLGEPFRSALVRAGAGLLVPGGDLPLGAIVAVAQLLACEHTGRGFARASWLLSLSEQEQAFGDYSPDRFGWFLSGVRPLPEPVPCRGSLGLWDVPTEVAARTMAVLS
jgi:hypothetical protein